LKAGIMTEIDFDILLAFTLLAVSEDIGPERQDIAASGWPFTLDQFTTPRQPFEAKFFHVRNLMFEMRTHVSCS